MVGDEGMTLCSSLIRLSSVELAAEASPFGCLAVTSSYLLEMAKSYGP